MNCPLCNHPLTDGLEHKDLSMCLLNIKQDLRELVERFDSVYWKSAQQSVQSDGARVAAECRHGNYGTCADCAIESLPPRR